MNRSSDVPTAITMENIRPLLAVSDMPTSLRFYRDLLGFTVISSAPDGAVEDRYGWVLLRHGTAELMLNTAYDPKEVRPPQPEPKRMAAHGDTCLFIACPDVDAAHRHLRSRGIDVEPPSVTQYGMKQLYLTDPDDFALCFQWPADRA